MIAIYIAVGVVSGAVAGRILSVFGAAIAKEVIRKWGW